MARRRRFGRRSGGGRKPLSKAVWSKLARKVGPKKASALARRNPSKAKRLAGGRGGRRGSRSGRGSGIMADVKAGLRKVADVMPL